GTISGAADGVPDPFELPTSVTPRLAPNPHGCSAWREGRPRARPASRIASPRASGPPFPGSHGIVDALERGRPVVLRVDDEHGVDPGQQPVHDPLPLAIELDERPLCGQPAPTRPRARRDERVVARRPRLAALGMDMPDRARDVARTEIHEQRLRGSEA